MITHFSLEGADGSSIRLSARAKEEKINIAVNFGDAIQLTLDEARLVTTQLDLALSMIEDFVEEDFGDGDFGDENRDLLLEQPAFYDDALPSF